MNRLRFAFLIAALLALGATQTTRRPVSRASRVVLVSFDAGSDELLDRLLRERRLKGGAFERIASQGLMAESMTPPSVASTPVSHPTLFSGAWPGRHGITGASLPGAAIADELVAGFNIKTDVDRLWTIAERAGKRVVCIMAPGAEATRPDNTCSETVPFAIIGAAQPVDVAPPPGNELAARLLRSVGPSPGEPDARLATGGEISDDEYLARAERFAEFLGGAVGEELKRHDWDLLVTYLPFLDNIEHRFLLADRRQAEYDEENGARRIRFAGYIERAHRKVDDILAQWLKDAPDTTFVIVSDHGMVPTHTAVLLNNVLAHSGLQVGGSNADVRAVSSGASAQIYVNAPPRFASGVVAAAAVSGVVEKALAGLRSIRDPSGSAVLSTVAARRDFGPLNLQHPNAGDIYVSARSGWSFSSRFDPAVPDTVPSTLSPDVRRRISQSSAEASFLESGGFNEVSLGVHGHRPGDPRLQAWFMAIGPGVPHRRTGVVQMIDVTPTVLSLLGVAAPTSVSGHAIW